MSITQIPAALVADNAITLAKLAGGTDGNIISFDASGDPVAIATGSDGQALTSGGAGAAPAFADVSTGATLHTDQATTSGSAYTFGNIPSGTKRITISFENFSPSATSKLKVTIGDAGGLETSGYTGLGMYTQNASGGQASATGYFIINMSESEGGEILNGHCFLTLKDTATYEWVQSHVLQMSSQGGMFGGGSKALSAELTQVSVSLVSGSGDAGSINIMYD